DLGRLPGVPAHLGELERTALGPFKKEDCFEMEDVEKLFKESPSAFAKILKPLEYVFRSLPKISVSSEEAKKVQNGVLLPQPKDIAAKRMAIYNEEDEFLAIYRQHPKKNGWMKPEKVFASSSRPDRR
ncbi:tRNA pseudouridine(55) synthase TruB, partial [Salmonella enterica subsp. enterica serovar Enteritidis]|uniref:hypothetical protein n=1 Tax=Salmonella enterica TaxID=28901 RepID=UPI001A0546AE